MRVCDETQGGLGTCTSEVNSGDDHCHHVNSRDSERGGEGRGESQVLSPLPPSPSMIKFLRGMSITTFDITYILYDNQPGMFQVKYPGF